MMSFIFVDTECLDMTETAMVAECLFMQFVQDACVVELSLFDDNLEFLPISLFVTTDFVLLHFTGLPAALPYILKICSLWYNS